MESNPWIIQAHVELKIYPYAFNSAFLVEDAFPEEFLTFVSATNPGQPIDGGIMRAQPGSTKSTPTISSSEYSQSQHGQGDAHVRPLPPPPPPPPEPFKFNTESFSDLEDVQERLRDASDALIGSRFRLQTQRRELRTTREQAGSRAGAAISLLKRYLQDNNIDFPTDIDRLFTEADNLRDNLGTLEVDYEEAEEQFNLEEFRYVQKQEGLIEHLGAFRQSFPMLPAQTYTETPQRAQGSYLAGTADMVHEVATEPKDFVSTTASVPVQTVRPVTVPAHSNRSAGAADQHLSRSLSESHLDHPRFRWSETRERINEWLLDTLSQSTFQKQRLHDLIPGVQEDDHDDQGWLQLATQHWFSGTPHTSAFHTGDTTGSDSLTSLTVPVIALEEPSPVDPSTLLDLPERVVQERLGYLQHPSAIATVDLEYGSEDRRSATRALVAVPFEPTEPEEVDSTPLLPEQGERDSADTESRSFSERFVHSSTTPTLPPPRLASPPLSSSRSCSPEHALVLPPAAALVIGRVDSLHPDSNPDGPPSPPVTRSPSPGRGRPVQRKSAQFIQISGQDSWTLPLVWLSPATSPERQRKGPPSDFVPFVSLPDTPFRLPGPSDFH